MRRIVRSARAQIAVAWASFERRVAAVRRRIAGRPGGDLPTIAARHKTDKWGTHRYAQHYDTHLWQLRDRPITLLEIGIGGYANPRAGGRSLRMWKEYFPKARIVGVDIHDKSALAQPRIAIVQADQSDASSLRAVHDRFGPFDVIVDDGSHFSEHVRITFQTLFPLLADDGIYCIEDLQTSYWPEYGGAIDLQDPSTSMALVKHLVDGLNYEEHVDAGPPSYSDLHITGVHCYHNLVVIQKGENAEGGSRKDALRARHADRVPAAPV